MNSCRSFPELSIPEARRRRAVGLVEVIICTALIAVLVIPVAGVIRSSAQSIQWANGGTSTEAELRRSLRWLCSTIRSSDVISVRTFRIRMRLESGEDATVQLQQGNLVMRTRTSDMTIAQSVNDIRFTESVQLDPPRKRIGVSILVTATDPTTGRLVTVDTTVAIRPQI